MTKTILFQLDVDPHPSSFDAVVAVDAGVDHLFQYGSVQAEAVEALVHGAMFTRGGDDLKNSAIFIGGNDVVQAEALFRETQKAFFGPVRVSVMLDASGCNTTAAAAVASASRHVELDGGTAVVLGGTGPVGRRVAQMLARQNANVLLTSRSLNRAETACKEIGQNVSSGNLEAAAPEDEAALKALLEHADIIIASGAAGVELASKEILQDLSKLRVAIDLNAVPPAGLGGVEAFDKAKPMREGSEDGPVSYGPIGVGGLKMRTHKAAIAKLFTSNSLVFDADEIYDLTIEQMNR
ncbi:NADP-dependent methylenetetrahydromethanopterin/methylenetetrahydrofolate dehydrogenase [Rhodopirellula sp. JC740]|uniref:NADP-dependent methylenetetrahydromethanopterin/methylenetetrahydrofolate dehydrogenase n=1 Tax=Rhodopirellula halodulae TaxID=2894198 RepID=A0ABS8NH82_9BACT|nr:NADP-dependent methylenetetrahydromethanopterin/methylenetetrahydrofolate dehydrogenase [Rhodopirellula sp. JC740]MCC9642307.1 NADP-dependent methylenetetrahydromethanopterin/methylenetetrahydrofolate dehydrogenase [Rhodopirellula sp. JC740]